MKCEHCGHEQASGRFCDACGRMLTRIMVEPEGGGADGAGAAEPKLVKCRYCGHQQVKGRFCDDCGMMFDAYRVEDEVDGGTARCPMCAIISKTPVCPNCGLTIPGFPTGEET